MTSLKWKTVYSETVIQSSYKNCHFSNFGESIVRYLKFRCTLVKIPMHNFQFRTGANLNYFIFDEKHSTFYLGKKLNILLNQIRCLLVNQNRTSLIDLKYTVWCSESDVIFARKSTNTYCHYQTRISASDSV